VKTGKQVVSHECFSLDVEAVIDAYRHLQKAKCALHCNLMALELGEIESTDLTNRFAYGKLRDARGRILAHLTDGSPLLNQVNESRKSFEGTRKMCLTQFRKR
jgi:hypothetical protein